MRKGFFRKTLVYTSILIFLVTVIISFSTNTIAEDPIVHPEFEWIVDASGNYFEITNSSYLNITMSSSENVEVYLESYPKTVSFHIKRNCMADSTSITLSNFEANKLYYRYQDGHLMESFTTDATGSYSYTQDLMIRHHVYIEETTSTIYIYSSGDVSTTDIQRDGNVYTFLNNISDSGGIRIYKSDITLDGNGYTLDGLSSASYTYGIYFYNQHDITIKNLHITGYKNGIYCSSNSDNISISNNIFSNNVYNDVVCYYCSNVLLKDNVVSSTGSYGFQLYRCSGTFTVDNNMISNKTAHGLYSYSISGTGPVFTITNNNIQNISNVGIFLYYSDSGATIISNTISNCSGYGIYCLYSSNIEIIDNTVSSCHRGIVFAGSGSSNIIIMKNTISSGEWGIYCSETSDVTIKENSITNVNEYGIYFYYATSTIVTENTISDCTYGLYLYYSTGNTFHHNNIITNTYQVNRYYGNPVNTWDDGNGHGNYWSDYGGTDTNGDGVGDTNVPHPYTQHSYGYYQLDYYPLINQWTPINHPPIADAGGPYICDEGFSITLDASGSYDSDWDNLQYRWDFDYDGVWDTSWSVSPKYTDIWGDDTSSTVAVEVSDGELTSTATSSFTVNNVVPEVSILGGGIGVADNYVFVTDWDSRSYFIEIDEENGVLSNTYEMVDDKDARTGGAAVGDFDNDGDFDALYGDDYNTWYYEKIGPGNDFASAVSIDYGYHNIRCDFAEADFNNDGNLDAIMTYYMSVYYCTIYLGNGDGTFISDTISSPTRYMGGIDSGDFNTDGNMDFVFTNLYGGGYLYFGYGDGTFQSPIYISTGSSYEYSVCAGDFDNDGDDDLILGYINTPARFYAGDGYGNFDTPISLDFLGGYRSAKTDINGDGNLDIVYNDWNSVYYITGNGDGTFTLASSIYIGGSLRGVATGPPSGDILIDEGYLEGFIGEFFDFGWLDTHTAVWNWGDGSPTDAGTVTEENIAPLATGNVSGNHPYGDNGEYTVTLTVTDDDGGFGSGTVTVNINNVAPAVDAGNDQTAIVGIPVDFNGSFTDPGWLDTHTIEWDWGDNTPVGSGTLTPQHTFTQPGAFTVTLTVTDDDGDVGTDTLIVTVIANQPPIANANGPYVDYEGNEITFNASGSTDPDNDTLQYRWDFNNDGTWDTPYSSNSTVTNTWYDDYSGTVAVEVYDGEFTDIATATVSVLDLAPTAGFTWNPEPQYEGSHIQFSDTSTSYPDDIVHWTWDFGGIGTSHETNPSYAFFDDGTYNVCLTVRDDDGSTDTICYTVTVLDLAPTAGFTWNPEPQYEGSHIQFSDTSTSYPDNIIQWSWDFAGIGTSLETNPSYAFFDDGTYNVCLTVRDDDGSTDTICHSVTVINQDPWIVDLLSDSYTTDEGSLLTLGVYGGDDGTDDLTFTWSWGDDTPDDSFFYPFGGTPPSYYLNRVSHSYANNGVYTVTLNIQDDDGGFTSCTTTVTVNNVIPHTFIYGGIGVTDGYIMATTYFGETYYVDIDEYTGTFADPELLDTKDYGCYGVGMGDFDNDGDIDALVGDEYNTWYYEKIGPGNDFAEAVSIDDTHHYWYRMDFAEADFNNDGNLDAIMAEYYDYNDYIPEFYLYLGNGNGEFAINSMQAPIGIIGMDTADFNNDGNMDFIAASWLYDGVFIYLGNGDGTFESPNNLLNGMDSWGVCAGDFDNDGDDDFLFGFSEVYPYSNPVMFYPNNGDGTFGTPVNIGLPSYMYAMADEDVDNDGNLDIIFSTGRSMWYYTGNGDGTFTFISSDIIESSLYGIKAEAGTQEPLDAYEGELIPFTGRFSDPGWLDTHSATWNWGDGNPTETGIISEENSAPLATGEASVEHLYGDNGLYIVTLTVTDNDGGSGDDNITINVYNVAPTITSLTAPIDPVQLGTPIYINADFTDPGFLDTHTASIDWGDDIVENIGTVTSPIQNQPHTYATPGVYTVTLTVTDDDGDSDSMSFKYVVIYDPSAGFVTGGGWIMSPEGAYTPDSTLVGKANFGFVAKYKKGQSTPDGNTEFQFKVANMNFHSSDYEWLVIQIAGAKAMYKGTGTINGEGNYGFKLTAIDEDLTPSTDVDMFRIKIWDKDNNDEIIYDNQLGDEDDADPSTPISGGNIRIHEG